MVETLINTRTGGAPIPTDTSPIPLRTVDSAAVDGARANAFVTPAPQVLAAPLTRSAVAPDALIAAQQLQDTNRARVFDARRAYGDAQTDRRPSSPAFDAYADAPQRGADIIDLFSAAPVSRGQDDLTFEAVNIPKPPQDRSASLSASRAYVGSGAHDGGGFGGDTSGGGRLQPGSLGIDIII